MWKPTTPRPDPDAAADLRSGANSGEARDGCRKAYIAKKAGVTSRSGPSDEGNLNDAWLVELARHGDHQAFAVLVRRYERKLIRVLTRLVREPEQARDLAQETFWRVYARLDRFDTARRFGPWLFRVGVNLGLDWLRSSKSDPPLAASIDRSGGDGKAKLELPDPDPRIQAELAQEVQFVLALLPVTYRTILVLRDLEGFLFVGGGGDRGATRGDCPMAVVQGPRKIPGNMARRQDEVRGGARDGETRYGQVDG